MKVLLTGATGFVGSHLLDCLRAEHVPVAILLRPTSDTRFIARHLGEVEARRGSIGEPGSVEQALEGVTHVIHCAGAVRALSEADFYTVNQRGTHHVVQAVNRASTVRRLVHISSLAAAGPASAAAPVRENEPPRPVSAYGRSKLAAEQEVQQRCQKDFVILRPPAVYGPRDGEFLRLFQAVQSHLRPSIAGGRQELSLVYVEDLTRAVWACLRSPAAAGQTYFVAAPAVVTGHQLAQVIAEKLGTWSVRLPIPRAALWLMCAWQEGWAHWTRRPNVLSRQKFRELVAPGWVCDSSKLHQQIGVRCETTLEEGIERTLKWYRNERWL